jgi:hypothetical protein
MFHHPTIQEDVEVCVQCQVHQGMHEHFPSFKPCFPLVGKMGEWEKNNILDDNRDVLTPPPTLIEKSMFGYLSNME